MSDTEVLSYIDKLHEKIQENDRYVKIGKIMEHCDSCDTCNECAVKPFRYSDNYDCLHHTENSAELIDKVYAAVVEKENE